MASSPPVSITTEQFLEIIFGPGWTETWVCSFPAGRESWAGRRYVPGYTRDDTNNYFCIGMLDPSADRRASDSVVEHHLIFADDIGTKVDPAKWDVMFAMGFPEPTFRIETSPGNQTWIWVLRKPIHRDDADGVRALRVARQMLGQLGLSDPLPDDARYIRLPSGINSKQKYLDQFGFAPTVRLVHGPGEGELISRLDIEQAAAILAGPDWRTKPDEDLGIKGGTSFAGALQRTADLNNPEPIIQLGIELGMNCQQVRPGVVEADCPNIAQHTTRADTGFAFLGNGLMECNHASCQHLRTPDFEQMMCDAYDQRQEAKIALGMLPAGEPATADEFLARASFAYADAKRGESVSQLVEQADVIAAETQQRTQARVARQVQDEADLAARFAYVGAAGMIFDLDTRRTYTPSQYDALPEVTRVVPYGGSGAKRAFARLLNHPNRTDIDTFCYVPGNPDPIVKRPNEFGQLVPCGNRWVGPDIPQVPKRPDVWLTHMAYLYDTPEALEFVLDFMAYILQSGTGRTSIVPILLGNQGIGKDMAWGPMIRLLGPHNVHPSLDQEQMLGTFTDFLERRLIIMPELKLNSRRAYDAFKNITSVDARRVTINRKHQQPYDVDPVHIVVGMTNNWDALCNMDPDDRRVWVHESGAKRLDIVGDKNTPGSQAYFQHVQDTIQTEDELGRILWLLMNRDISRFNPHAAAPDFTGAKQSMLVDTLPPAARWAYDAVRPGGLLANRTVLTVKEVHDLAAGQGGPHVIRFLTPHAIAAGLAAAGCENGGRVGTVNAAKGIDNRIRLWFTPRADQARRAAFRGGAAATLYEQERDDWQAARLAGVFPTNP